MKKILLTLVCLVYALNAWAYDYMDENGICYNINSYNKTASVTYYSSNSTQNGKHFYGDIVIPEQICYESEYYTVTRIESDAIKIGWDVESVKLPSTIQYIGKYGLYLPNVKAFYISDLTAWCKTEITKSGILLNSENETKWYVNDEILTEITIPEEITQIKNYTFSNWNNLEKVVLHQNVVSIGESSFECCKNLSQVVMSNNIKSIGNGAFNCCSKLATIEIPSSIEYLGGAFTGCGFTEFTYPAHLTTVPDGFFSNCSKLRTINLHSNITSLGSGVFGYCTSLEGISLPNSIKEIGSNAFYNCTALKNIVLPQEIKEIKQETFYGCTSLETIELPANLTRITDNPFGNNSMTLIFNGPTPPTFSYMPFDINKVILVPDESVDTYREAWSNVSTQILGKTTQTEFVVETKHKENSSGLIDEIDCIAGKFNAMLDVVKLTVTGTLNSYDIMAIRDKMLNLKELDLSGANIVDFSSSTYYENYSTEKDVIGPCFFKNMTRLRKVVIPNSVTNIDHHAFEGCTNISNIDLSGNVKKIGQYAFKDCSLQNIIWPETLEEIGEYAFSGSYKNEILNLPENVKAIKSYAFYDNYDLKKVNFPPKLEIIEDGSFLNCYNIEDISLPTTLTSIGTEAFCRTKAEKIQIPSSVKQIGNRAFGSSYIKEIYTWTIQPTEINQETFGENTYRNATLYVPETAQKLYYYGNKWSQFQNIKTSNKPYEYFYLTDKDLMIEENTVRIDGKPNADFGSSSGLIVEGDGVQNLGEVTLEADNEGNAASIIGNNSSTEATNANVNIDDLTIKIEIKKNKWYFFAFPFDVPYSSIHFNGQFIWYYYDGEVRALQGSGAWKNVKGDGASEPVLERGKGYAFQASKDGTLSLKIGKASINGQDKMITLESHAAEDAQNASWNLIGNPFTSYYELSALGYDAPVTIWNGSTYVAYTPKDDDLTLYPFQAFFVQKPSKNVDNVGFMADGRETKNQSENPDHKATIKARMSLHRAPANTARSIINLEVSDGETYDKTRVVFNEKSQMDYELECDAAKFLSSSAPQIYTIDQRNVQYAINERPEGSGEVRLGFTAQKAGTFTIKAKRMDVPMMLKDLKTGITCDLSENDYSFDAKIGTDNERFLLVRGGGSTGIDSVEAEGEDAATYVGVNGVELGKNKIGGVMIEKNGNGVRKVMK